MKVNISYSVDLDEVLDHVHRLYVFEEGKLGDVADKIKPTLRNTYTDEKIITIIKSVEEYQEALESFAAKLAEISNILDGYHSLKFNPEPDTNEQREEEIE